ncbi:sugar ABC transporter permease [Lacticaseibacillus nasuensis]|nr:sugar ABC transporter permease [Lacticaseibacillus nasuensis]
MMKRRHLLGRSKEALTAYLMLLPDTIGLAIFIFVPMLFAVYTSFHSWNGIEPMKFIGLANYKRLIGDVDFWTSLVVTLKYSIVYIPAVYCVSLGLALLINKLRGKFELFTRMAFFLPYSISTVVAGLLWMFMYDPKSGYFNVILSKLGIPKQQFLASSSQALLSVVVVSVWLIVGYNMIIFLAALKEVPLDYYEAADLDGASAVQKFLHITLPSIKNTSLFILVVTTIGSFQVFDQIKVMTNGGPAKATEVTVFHIYNQAFTLFDFGYSSTMAVALLVIIMILSLFQFKLLGRKE